MATTKIAIVGAHRDTKLLAPYDDAAWAVWSLSMFNESELPRHDVWFELHARTELELFGPVYLEWLRQLPLVYMQAAWPEYPGSRRYPLNLVKDEFGPYFFSGSISYLLALAILEQPDTIGLWGISPCPEMIHQKPSLWHFIAEADRRGIEVIAPPELLDPPPLYGWEISDYREVLSGHAAEKRVADG